jgi:hypothetical protein
MKYLFLYAVYLDVTLFMAYFKKLCIAETVRCLSGEDGEDHVTTAMMVNSVTWKLSL